MQWGQDATNSDATASAAPAAKGGVEQDRHQQGLADRRLQGGAMSQQPRRHGGQYQKEGRESQQVLGAYGDRKAVCGGLHKPSEMAR